MINESEQNIDVVKLALAYIINASEQDIDVV